MVLRSTRVGNSIRRLYSAVIARLLLGGSMAGFLGAIAVGGSAPTVVLAADERILYTLCLVPQDRVARATERAFCDGLAESGGFAQGIVSPFRCIPGQQCENPQACQAGEQSYMCTGVGGPPIACGPSITCRGNELCCVGPDPTLPTYFCSSTVCP